jgi:TRAP-type C4-dicarboxylate transport system substrate-binding protein
MRRATFLGLLFSLVCLATTERVAHATVTLKIATIAPQESPWGKEFKQWAKDVADDTKGEVQLDFLWNAQAGDEPLMVQKIRTGQIDGAAVTPLGLVQTGVNDIMLFALPGLFTSWQKLDQVRDALKPDLMKDFEQKGFTVLGWGDVGALKEMTVGFELHHPTDLRGKGVYFYTGDPITPKVYAAIGGINPRQLMLTEVLPELAAGTINVIMAPPLGAEQLQWSSRVDHINTQTLAFAIGALIMSSTRLAAMPPNLRQVVLARGAETSDRLQKRIRNLDAQSYARMKATKKAYDPSPDEIAEWAPIFIKVGLQLRGGMFTPALFDRVIAMADNPILNEQIKKSLKANDPLVRQMIQDASKSSDPIVRNAAQRALGSQ